MRFIVVGKANRAEIIAGMIQNKVGINLNTIEAVSAAEAEGIGMRYAQFMMPQAEGWTGHWVTSEPADQLLKPESEWRRL